jgi:hypothetical protein
VVTEFRYGGRIIAEGMVVSGTLQVARATVPYHGGPLHNDAFEAVTYASQARIPGTACVVLISTPIVTELEQAIHERVSGEHSGALLSMPTFSWPAEPLPVETPAPPDTVHEHVDREDLSGLDVTASAQTLLRTRMRIRKRR